MIPALTVLAIILTWGEGEAASPPQPLPLTTSVCAVSLLWERITTGGHNACGDAVPCAAGASSTRAAMASAKAKGFEVLRFAASGFWPVDHALFVNSTTRPLFFAALDSVFDDAKRLGVRLIPSMQWNHWAFVDVCHESLGRDMMRNASSCSYIGTREFVTTLVARYSTGKYADVVYAWELGNELNLLVDLSHANSTIGCAPQFGTPAMRAPADNFTTADMVEFQRAVAGWVRGAAGANAAALLSSGHAVPRGAAHHLALSYNAPQRDWTADSAAQLQSVLTLTHRDLDLISVHIYPGPAACAASSTPSAQSCPNYRWGTQPWDLLAVAADAAAASGKAVYLGEFGVSLPDRHNASSPIYNFTERMLTAAQQHGVQLATLWSWELGAQNATYAIYPANATSQNDARTIRALQRYGTAPYVRRARAKD